MKLSGFHDYSPCQGEGKDQLKFRAFFSELVGERPWWPIKCFSKGRKKDYTHVGVSDLVFVKGGVRFFGVLPNI